MTEITSEQIGSNPQILWFWGYKVNCSHFFARRSCPIKFGGVKINCIALRLKKELSKKSIGARRTSLWKLKTFAQKCIQTLLTEWSTFWSNRDPGETKIWKSTSSKSKLQHFETWLMLWTNVDPSNYKKCALWSIFIDC